MGRGRGSVTAKSAQKPRVRVGRPPRNRAGEVDDRILDAARQVFLKHGLGGASIDEIARLARAGKPTIYARFPTKESLFTAVGERNARFMLARFGNEPPTGADIEERLASIGNKMLERFLVDDTIDFMRLAAAEARRFPQLAKFGVAMRERGAEAVAHVFREAANSDGLGRYPAFGPNQIMTTTRFFIDLVVARFLLRALFGENLKQLRTEIDSHVTRAVAFFLAACRNGGIE